MTIKTNKYINQHVEVKGWYRRSPVPYIEIYTMTVDGKVKKCYTYAFTIGLLIVLLCIGAVILATGLIV